MSDYEYIWPSYSVKIAEPDTRTASQRMADEMNALRSDLVLVLAAVQELNQRMAVVEHLVKRLEVAEAL